MNECENGMTMKDKAWFRNQSFLITGGSSGIGLEISRQLLIEGAKVIIVSNNPNEFSQARIELIDSDQHFEFHNCDITNVENRKVLRKELESRRENLVGLINCVGILTY